MTDAQTPYELRLIFPKPGCPVCTLVRRAGARWIKNIFDESMLDPLLRQKLVDSLGFCYEHTWQSIDLKLSDALGHAILYHNLMDTTLKSLTGPSPSVPDPKTDCPACRVQAENLDLVLDALRSALRAADFAADYRQSDGLCLPHLRLALAKADKKAAAVLISHQCEKLTGLKAELAEFIRKNDYRFKDEPMGSEGDSYKRGAEFVAGIRRAKEKKDL
jgi:hypothetical protein